PDYVVDNYYCHPAAQMDADWQMRDSLRYTFPRWGGCQEIRGSYSDAGHPRPRQVQVQQRSIVSRRSGGCFAVLVYDVMTDDSVGLSNCHAGIFCDFDIVPTDKLHDQARADRNESCAFMWNTLSANPTVGVTLLAGGELSCASVVDNARYRYPDSAMSEDMKFRFLSGLTSQGASDRCGDWSLVLGVGPFDLTPGLTHRLAFALAAGADSGDFRASCDSARQWYERYVGVTEGSSRTTSKVSSSIRVHPNPGRGILTICYTQENAGRVSLLLYDASGRLVRRVLDRIAAGGESIVSWQPRGVSPGVYVLRLVTESGGQEAKILVP
ncbi:MAG: T9SS type A sorting domain-containing protein, partial [candidate division WOR-3 bacterium]